MPPNYDSLLGKLVVWGEDRTQAIARMQRALNEMVISGVTTTIIYHTMLLDLDDFKAGNVDTGFIPNHADELKEPPPTKPVRTASLVMICQTLSLVPCQCRSVLVAMPCLQQAKHAATAGLFAVVVATHEPTCGHSDRVLTGLIWVCCCSLLGLWRRLPRGRTRGLRSLQLHE